MGIGGTRSIGILKALRKAKERYKIIVSDINPINPGFLLADKSYLIPAIHSSNLLISLSKIIKKEKINIVFSTSNDEVEFFSRRKEKIEKELNTILLVPNNNTWSICNSKYKTQKFFIKNNFTYIPTIIFNNLDKARQFAKKYKYPLIKKMDSGFGSRNMVIINNDKELSKENIDSNFILQKYINNDFSEHFGKAVLSEFTAEVFVNKDYSIAGGIIIKRFLVNGESKLGKIIKDDAVLEYLFDITKKLHITGPCNFQFKIKNKNIYIFEINPLYSGTTVIRAHFGFNSPELAVESFIKKNHKKIDQKSIQEGYFVRYWEEAYLSNKQINQIKTC